MQKVLIALACTALMGLSGCAEMDKKTETSTVPVASSAKPTLNAEAQAALAAAQADVKTAKSKNALWTTAEEALKAAETAAEAGDSATVLKQSAIAQAHAKLGVAQLTYPQIPLSN